VIYAVAAEQSSILPPTVTTDPPTNITATTATLNGTLDDDGGEECDCSFEWGETDSYGNSTTPVSKETGQSFSANLTDLDPNTTYHFRAKAVNSAGTEYGEDEEFKTWAEKILLGTCAITLNILRKLFLTKSSSINLIPNRNSIVNKGITKVANIVTTFKKYITKEYISLASSLGSVIKSRQFSKILAAAAISAVGSMMRLPMILKILTTNITIISSRVYSNIYKIVLNNVLVTSNIPRRIWVLKLAMFDVVANIKKRIIKFIDIGVELIGILKPISIFSKVLNIVALVVGSIPKRGYLNIKILVASITAANSVARKLFKILSSVANVVSTFSSIVPKIRFLIGGHVGVKPEMMIKKWGDGALTITNLISGDVFEMTDLTDGEVIYVNNEKQIISSDLSDNRYTNLTNYSFMELKRGLNILVISGARNLKFRYRHIFKH
ncbi:MAG: fibronectin type III domain-containing protein, partial [Methanofastidiosum sp.]